MKKEHINEIKGIIVFAIAVIFFVSFLSFIPEDISWYNSNPNSPVQNKIGIVGAYIAGSLFFVFGLSAYFLVVFLFFWGWNKFTSREIKFTVSKFISFLILFCVLSAMFSMVGSQNSITRFERSGVIGFLISDVLIQYLSRTGAYIILLALGSLTLVVTGEFLISPLLFKITETLHDMVASTKDRVNEKKSLAVKIKEREKEKEKLKLKPAVKPQSSLKDFFRKKVEEQERLSKRVMEEEQDFDKYNGKEKDPASASAVASEENKKPNIRITGKPSGQSSTGEQEEKKVVGEYHLPQLDLLAQPQEISKSKIQNDLTNNAGLLEATLNDFNVSVRVVDIERGPAITRYELEPAPGVKIQKITTLADDIALAMKAPAVRIVAPIPGKNRVGIEVPNTSTAAVYLREVLAESRFQSSDSKLMLAIGKDISGKPLIANLAEMPHLMIAGTTGAGKTVCVNSLIMSMLFNASPAEVKFLMVDPKMVELTQYNDIPHMLCPTVTDAKKASAALNWVVGEMESRYNTLSKAGCRNIKAYHEKGAHNMPYIVIIIDELADLMQTSAKSVESAITRLAQLSRAVGIHLILATQRPSVNVITGVIKANFPARISFKVASKVDSRTVLDMNGAETLLGKGDLLFMKPGDAKPTRGQCSFVSDDEVHRVIEFIKGQQEPIYNDMIISQQKSGGEGGNEEKDELYDEALKLVIETNQASVSILQRRMRLGYTRAARLIDMMEQNGIVGPYCGSKPRDILVDREEWLLQNAHSEREDEKT